MQTRGESLEVITVARFHANENVVAVTKISSELTHPFALNLLNVQLTKSDVTLCDLKTLLLVAELWISVWFINGDLVDHFKIFGVFIYFYMYFSK